jgi:hypothetical protein
MLYVIGGGAALLGVLLLIYLFVTADPARLARALKWIGLGILVVAVLALAFVGRLGILLLPLSLVVPMLGRLRSAARGFRRPSAGRVSSVATAFLNMRLDHDAGTMTGTVLKGRFAGMRLEELGQAELEALLRECRAADDDSARLLEAYLDRRQPDWRAGFGAQGGGGAGGHPGGGPKSDIEEAYAVLGLAPGADAAAIKEAHHRLMKKVHPDHGGSDYLATKINRARDVLLHR